MIYTWGKHVNGATVDAVRNANNVVDARIMGVLLSQVRKYCQIFMASETDQT